MASDDETVNQHQNSIGPMSSVCWLNAAQQTRAIDPVSA